jgi:hypothetical protein
MFGNYTEKFPMSPSVVIDSANTLKPFCMPSFTNVIPYLPVGDPPFPQVDFDNREWENK